MGIALVRRDGVAASATGAVGLVTGPRRVHDLDQRQCSVQVLKPVCIIILSFNPSPLLVFLLEECLLPLASTSQGYDKYLPSVVPEGERERNRMRRVKRRCTQGGFT